MVRVDEMSDVDGLLQTQSCAMIIRGDRRGRSYLAV